MFSVFPASASELSRHLREHGVQPTLQRLAIASVLLVRPCHMTADQVLLRAREHLPELARATVYATLQLFVQQQLLRELPVDGAATVYDSNLTPHHHVYNVDTGEVQDLPADSLQVLGLPALGSGYQLDGVDVIVRVRARAV